MILSVNPNLTPLEVRRILESTADKIDNSNGQAPDAFKKGQYFLANLMYYPAPKVMVGIEGGWIHRDNFSDGWSEDDTHVQVSFKYSFSTTIGGAN